MPGAALMGWRIAEEVQEHAPSSLTWRELYVACVLANDASEHTRVCRPGLLTDEQLRRRLRIADKRELMRVMEKLVEAKVIERCSRGQKYRQAEFRFLPIAPAQGGGTAHPEDVHRTVQGGDSTHPEDGSGWGFSPLRVVDSPPQGGGNPHPSQGPKRDQSLSRQPDSAATVGTPDPPRERRGSDNDTPTPADTVLAAYAAALGRPVTNGTRVKLLAHAESLLAAGYPAPWLADRAREMAPRGWTDLEQHAERSTVPLPGATVGATSARPPWCGQCEQSTRLLEHPETGLPLGRCPRCHPGVATKPRPGAHQPYENPPDQSVYLGAIS